MEIILSLTWRCCCPLLGWVMASPQIITLSWSEGQKASSWSSSTDTTPEQIRPIVKRKYVRNHDYQPVFTFTINCNIAKEETSWPLSDACCTSFGSVVRNRCTWFCNKLSTNLSSLHKQNLLIWRPVKEQWHDINTIRLHHWTVLDRDLS